MRMFECFCILILYSFILSSQSQAILRVTYNTNLKEVLECNISNITTTALWGDNTDRNDDVFFTYSGNPDNIGNTTTDPKYANFDYEVDPDNYFNLIINNVDKDDGGDYLCTVVSGGSSVTYTVSVEVLPDLLPSLTCNSMNDCPSSSDDQVESELQCTCEAIGVRPATLQLQWTGAPATDTTNNTSGSDSDDPVTLSSNATVKPTSSEDTLTCTIIGYSRTDIPEAKISSNVTFAPPICKLKIACSTYTGSSVTLTCNCNSGQPAVTSYGFYYGNGSIIGDFTDDNIMEDIPINPGEETIFKCRGCNGVNYGKDSFSNKTIFCETSTTVSPTTTPDKTTTPEDYASTLGVSETKLVTGTTGKTKSNTGLIVGIVVGVVVLIVIIVLLIVFVVKPGKCEKKQISNDKPVSGNGANPEIPAYGVINKKKSSGPSPSPDFLNIPSEKDETV